MTIPAPPSIPDRPAGTAWQLLAPLLGSAGMIGFAVMMGDARYLVMAGMAGGVMIVSGIATRIVGSRSAKRRRAETAARYRTVLDDARTRLLEAADLHRSSIEHGYPAPLELLDLAAGRVWERRRSDPDFVSVRIGTGTVEAPVSPVLAASDQMAIAEPDLASEAADLGSSTAQLDGVPIVIDLEGCVAIVGDVTASRALCAAVIAQLAAFRAPSDLAVAGHIPSTSAADWDWLKWLPHTRRSRSGDDDATYLTADPRRLEAWVRAWRSVRSVPDRVGPRTLLLIDAYPPTSDAIRDRLDRILSSACAAGDPALTIVDRADRIPGCASASITIEESGTLTYREMHSDGLRMRSIEPDAFDRSSAESLARTLAPLRERTSHHADALAVGLLGLLGESAEGFSPERTWNDRSTVLTTPIGLDAHGERLMLDIREAALGGMGPHGMLIGATGSGKSELLRTLVLGLAATNSPEDLSLLLADFKGGATFAGLEALPHTAGAISNLEADPTLVDRMQEALFGELERRQRLLRQAEVDRVDEYRRERDRHPEREALPSLLFVVDEFGELLAARPDFTELFASIGRTGRSLGVHLLLSSQRLDESRIRRLDGHLRYRICLRTFSPEESRAVIGSRASFDLPALPGVGHLAVDSEISRFTAGLVNRPVAQHVPTALIRRFEMSGATTAIGTQTARTSAQKDSTSEMELMLDRLRPLGPAVRPVWLDPLPRLLDFDPDPTAETLTIAVGTSDLPRHQQAPRAVMDFSGSAGNLAVIGGPRSGKSTTLATIVTSFAATHDPQSVAFHAIDLGGGELHRLGALPHVGSVFGRADREEIPRLVRHVHSLLERRIDRAGGGHVFLVVDNWGLFSQEFGSDLTDLVTEILAAGLDHGVHVLMSAGRWQDIRLAARDAIGGRFELRLSDPIDSEIDRHAAQMIPPDVPGRGIDRLGRATQIMRPPAELDPIVERWAAARSVTPVRTLPTAVTESDVREGGGIGLSEHGPDPWGPDLFGPDPHFLILGDTESGKTTSLRGLIRTLGGRDDVEIGIVDYRRRLDGEVSEAQLLGRAGSAESAEALIALIHSELSGRRTDGRHRRSRRSWVLVVDDYDLVAEDPANPVARIADVVSRGRDLGFHVVLSRRVAGMSRGWFDPLLQRLREMGTPTLLLDGDPGEGSIVGTIRASRRPPGRGLVVSRSVTTLVQIAEFRPRRETHEPIDPEPVRR